jgi:hypothetical protein
MILYIPELGDQLKLTKEWAFNLHAEDRNRTLGTINGYECQWIQEALNTPRGIYNWWVKEGEKRTYTIPIVLPPDTILKVDRIYIRKGAEDFSSISFYITNLPTTEIKTRSGQPNKTKRAIRFWAKLNECNTIEFEKI